VKSGNRKVFVIATTLIVVALCATDAGRVGEDGTGAMWVAPELLALLESPASVVCNGVIPAQPTGLPTHGKVTFEWNPETGELWFDPAARMPGITLPEGSPSVPSALALQSCESR
jgi:hypothetical protein